MGLRGLSAAALVALLSGCGGSVVQSWEGSQPPLPPYSGPVCLLPKALPADVEYVLLGRAVSNLATYGGFAKVNGRLSEVARSVGADAVIEKRSKMKWAPIPWGAARPQVWGFAVRLKDPKALDCEMQGGRLYLNGERLPPSNPASAELPANAQTYDNCMARVGKISDPALRERSMSLCDDL